MIFFSIGAIGAFENYLKLFETSGNFWKISWKFPETSKPFAGDGNFQSLVARRVVINYKDIKDNFNEEEILIE